MSSLAKVTARAANLFAYYAGLLARYSVVSSSRLQNRLRRLIFMDEGSTLLRWAFPSNFSIKARLLNRPEYLNS